jgi:ubiquinone/menaquinone biosynthesis C-methylase UbiE
VNEHHRHYIPAAGHDWLLPLYDPLQKLLGTDRARRELIAQASLRPHQVVLDIGCGTGTLVVLIKSLHPDIEVVGLDPDPKALARARRKAGRASLSVRFDQGFSNEMPYPDRTFDRVFSSFMFHHLDRSEKAKTLTEVRRVLKPGGSLHLLDFGGGEARGGDRLLARVFHAPDGMRDNFEGRVAALMAEAGFTQPTETAASRATLIGRVAYYSASVPD